ncbi:DNA-directed RNA polymerase II subunit RPB1-like [Chelmon rostratus]|uniref:DNA-directed RNA polymerase II subunit RPB1-like n=1 Tax=Chelmon rostratus TaxID=109905 RepID=UPI001BE76211|nr:DNA-directed RNA polymerase II subunit RPB1-like [Chelmon rostratus]XP_041808880.1 DNA-directed RNA polymerase II subunit RPB1-like [Chelmon rostratus]
MHMDLLRKYMWVWVIGGMLFVCLVISLIFLLINKCISRGGKHRISQLHKGSDFSIKSNKYQERSFKAGTPPLPPRTQFLTAEAQSYENLAEEPAYEEATPNYEEATPDYEQATPDYVQAEPDYEQDVADYVQAEPDYEQATPDYVQAEPDYEQDVADYVQAEPDYEQDVADYVQTTPDYVQTTPDYEESIPDYVKVDEEKILLPPPPYQDPDPADNTSMEDYDDIGGEGEIEDEEDYDDLG